MKSYVVKEREDGSRFFDENTPTGQVSEDTIGAGLKIDAEGKVVVDKDDLSSDFVKKTGDESIEGLKTFTAPVGSRVRIDMKNNNMSHGEPITDSTYSQIVCVDKNAALVGALEVNQHPNGQTRSVLVSYNPSGSGGVNMGIGYRLSGDAFEAFTGAPTPPLTDNSNQIATTAWVKNVLPASNGFKVNPDGTVSVDFSQMDEATINAIRKEMGVKIPLTATKNFYVNGATGSDTLDEGRGESADKPFKTIQACINYTTETFDLLRFNLTINVAAGVYNEALTLGSYVSTTGTMRIVAQGSVTVQNSSDKNYILVNVKGGSWSLTGIDFVKNVNITSTVVNNSSFRVFDVATSYLLLYGGSLSCVASGAVPSGIVVGGALMNIGNEGNVFVSQGTSFNFDASILTKGRSNAFSVGASAVLYFNSNNTESLATYNINAVNNNVVMNVSGPAARVYFVVNNQTYRPSFPGTADGARKYTVSNGSSISTPSGESTFPGTVAGTVDASTYSWYK